MTEEEILFGGFGGFPSKIPEFKKSTNRDPRLVAAEEKFFKLTESDEGKRLYGDPNKGATLEQAWRTFGLVAGTLPVCLKSTDKQKVSTDAIKQVIEMDSNKLVSVLVDIFGMIDRLGGFQIFYHDGYIGHSIRLVKYSKNEARFTYYDSWPEYSLLCKDYNAAGVDAKKEGKAWSITSAELEKIIFAAFVFQNEWAEYIGEKYYITYDELKGTDFWSVFDIKEIGSQELDNNNNRIFILQAAEVFRSATELYVFVNRKSRVTKGQLKIKRRWMFSLPDGPNPVALGIMRSFIATLIPPPDKEGISELLNILNNIQNPHYTEQLIDQGPEKSRLHLALFTYLGVTCSSKMFFDYTSVNMINIKSDDTAWFVITVTIYAL